MHEHLIFFDHECPWCHKAVRHIIEIDVHKHFVFAPLNGNTADNILIGPNAHLRKANSIVLVEDYESTSRKFWIRSKAILRIYLLNGNGWGIIGILGFLPSFIIDPFYRWFAEHRHHFKLKIPDKAGPQDRFLP